MMHGLRIIRPLTKPERQHVERLYQECEAPGCSSPPECAITIELEAEQPLIVYACIEHARAWSEESGVPIAEEI